MKLTPRIRGGERRCSHENVGNVGNSEAWGGDCTTCILPNFPLQSMNKMHEIFVCCAFHPLYLPFVYICPPDLPSSRCFPVRGKRLPGKLTSLLSPPTRADRIYIACRFQVIVFVCVLRERDRARVELCLYFWPSKVFWNRSFGYGERRWRRWRQNSCKSCCWIVWNTFQWLVVVSIWAEENRNIYKCLVVDRTIEMMNWCEFPLNFFWKLASASYVWAWISSSE